MPLGQNTDILCDGEHAFDPCQGVEASSVRLVQTGEHLFDKDRVVKGTQPHGTSELM